MKRRRTKCVRAVAAATERLAVFLRLFLLRWRFRCILPEWEEGGGTGERMREDMIGMRKVSSNRTVYLKL